MTDNDSLTVTYRKRTFIITKCHHEAGAFTEGCPSCAPNWCWSCVELKDLIQNQQDIFVGRVRQSRVKPSRNTNDKVMHLPEVLAFIGQK